MKLIKYATTVILVFMFIFLVSQFFVEVIAKGNNTVEMPIYDNTEVLNEIEKEVLELINTERSNNGLEKLYVNKELVELANIKAKDLVENSYFSHRSATLRNSI